MRRNISQRLMEEYNRKLNIVEGVEYDPDHQERIHPDIEGKLRSRSHHLGGHPAFPETGTGQHFEEKVASKRFKEVVERVKRYSGSQNITQQDVMGMMRVLGEIVRKERGERKKLEKLLFGDTIKDNCALNCQRIILGGQSFKST